MTPSRKVSNHPSDIAYQRMLSEGNLYKQDLDKLLELFQLPNEVISKFGVLSIDFGYAREIIAVMGYKPRIIIAIEPSNYVLVNDVLDNLKLETNAVVFLRGGFKNNINQLLEVMAGNLFGLITWTNIRPELISKNSLSFFFRNISMFLHPDGLIIASTYSSTAFRSGHAVFKSVLLEEQDITLEYFDFPRTYTGEYYLIGRKK